MRDIVLYCKSYSRDFLRLKRLLDSINQFNQDQIPFYISTPSDDRALLIERLGVKGYIWVSDEEIVQANPKASLEKYQFMPGRLTQAIVKSEFWRLGFTENYLCLDSDCVFIRPFHKSDFIMENGLPYTVLHQNKEFFQLALDRGHEHVVLNLRSEAQRVKSLFGRVGQEFYGAPAPFVWSAKIWKSLEQEYLIPKGISIWELVTPQYPETLIYVEAAMKYQVIPLIAIEPLFRVYHYSWQYFLMKRLGENEEKLRSNYLGVIYQSNWESNLSDGQDKKTITSRMLKRVKNFLRYMQSYL